MQRRSFFQTFGALILGMTKLAKGKTAGDIVVDGGNCEANSAEDARRDLAGVIDAPWRNPIDVLLDLLRDVGFTEDQIDLGSFMYARHKADISRRSYALVGSTISENMDICADAAGGMLLWMNGKLVFFCGRHRQNPADVGAR